MNDDVLSFNAESVEFVKQRRARTAAVNSGARDPMTGLTAGEQRVIDHLRQLGYTVTATEEYARFIVRSGAA